MGGAEDSKRAYDRNTASLRNCAPLQFVHDQDIHRSLRRQLNRVAFTKIESGDQFGIRT
jgi:hypothetical protein